MRSRPASSATARSQASSLAGTSTSSASLPRNGNRPSTSSLVLLSRDEAESAERAAAGALKRTGFEEAPPALVATALGYELRRGLLEGATVKGSKVLEAKANYAPREAFTWAHELGHKYTPEGLRAEVVEAWCDRFAAALMLPPAAFLASCGEHVFDLSSLRQRWPWASWHALAWRVVDLCPGTAAARWDDGALLERRESGLGALRQVEQSAARDALRHGRGKVFGAAVLSLAWFIPSGRRRWAVSIALPC